MRVAINGFGRIGRLVFRSGLEKGVNFVAINDLIDAKTLAYLLKYDTIYKKFDKNIEFGEGFLKVGNKKINLFSEKEPEKLPWEKLKIDVVIESTGAFVDKEGASRHLKAGAKRVVISAPGKSPDVTIVPGVNDSILKKEHKIISMASCTTNALAPVVKVLDDEFGIKKGFMTTTHAYTSSQSLVDSPNKKLRRGRAAGNNIILTTSGATTSVAEVIPKLKGKLDGLAMRVPLLSGSIVDFVAELNKNVDKEQINNALKKASLGKLKGILDYTEEEIVSSDILGNTHSSIVDGLSTMAMGNIAKVFVWYDNEYGYASRLADFVKKLK